MTRALLWLAAAPALAHMMSMSSGDILIEGTRLRYELRMPLYEIQHVKDPQATLFQHIAFGQARLVSKSCEAQSDTYFCRAEYALPEPVELLDVTCTFHAATVPNHVHLLRAQKGDKRDQAIFDFSFPRAMLRFRPPTAFETFATQTGAGFVRALGGWAQVLFIAALALAARSRRELLALAGMFFAGELFCAWIVPLTGFAAAPRFVEAASALTIAYLAVEVILLPAAGSRWLLAGVLGIFHGLYFELFLRTTGFNPAYVMLGALIAEAALLALFAFVLHRATRAAPVLKPVQALASVLLVVGLAWFFWRLFV